MLKKDLEFEMTSMTVMIKPKDSRTPHVLPTIVMTHQVQL